jgi:Concanavalin A-like lectin/glucanases superfamily
MPALSFSPLPRHALFGSVIRAAVLVGVIASIGLSGARAAEPPERVVDGLQTLYTFEALVRGTIPDRAGVGEGIDLRIDKPDGVRFHAGRMGLDLPVVIASDGPATRLTKALRQAQQFSLEVWITPAEGEQTGPARIVSLSLDTSKRSLSLVQEKGRYELRLRTSNTSDNGTPATPTPDGTAVPRPTHLVATRTPDGVVRLSLDGKEVATNTVAGDMNRWPDDCRLVVGNEVSGDRAWRGEIALVALYARALSADEIARNFAAGPPQVEEAASLPPGHSEKTDVVGELLPFLPGRCFGTRG